ncbi:alpha/beta hydrolase fold domain-containing protein [Streptomyces sp. NPDC004629]|uniref:alpha/beta hydrolase fold domain-containing protein n=1 Tax=Streptomyces sp. NPDC004629 TaxID=3364705 RepID=UPI0036C3565A
MTRELKDQVFAQRDTGPLLMDLVLPDRPTGNDPAIIWLHGGGWWAGDRTLTSGLHRWFAAHGYVMASIEYRLSGQAIFPAQLIDVRSAVRHLRMHSREYGINPSAMGLWGSSAGGHLAALAGVTGTVDTVAGEPDGLGSCAVQAVADAYGPVDILAAADGAGFGSGPSPEARLLGGAPAECRELAEMANPVTWVAAGAPPFLIAHGDADVLVPPSHSILLHKALSVQQVESTLYLLDGYRHGFLNRAGVGDVSTHPLFDAGRLAAEGEAPSRVLSSGTRSPADAVPGIYSFDVIREFFDRHLKGPARSQEKDNNPAIGRIPATQRDK